MRKLVIALAVVGILAIGAAAFAYGPGWWGGGSMMGSGSGMGYGMMGGGMGPGMMGGGMGYGMMGGGMMGYGMGPGMMGGGYGTGRSYATNAYDQKFLDETKNLRKQLNGKRFEYFEALRNPKTTPDTIAKLEKEITELQKNIYAKASKTSYRSGRGANDNDCTR
ncbi:MAG TPA: hypothetical protein ENH50_06440 [Nitrospirae bacterium]|nr:hypothetical protein BMS3Abin08_01824 [bacterium BMS3Abin08]HDY71290.1 hypothetical protein [Nitrospirota bacterium]